MMSLKMVINLIFQETGNESYLTYTGRGVACVLMVDFTGMGR
jgi:hypothetical protein